MSHQNNFLSLLLEFQKKTPSISEDKCAQRTGTEAKTRTQAEASNGAGTETRAWTGSSATGIGYGSGSGTGSGSGSGTGIGTEKGTRTRIGARTGSGTATRSRTGSGTGSQFRSGTGLQSKGCSQTIFSNMGLPIGWEKDVDDSGRTFFYNRNQRKVQWDPPCYTSTLNSGVFKCIFLKYKKGILNRKYKVR